MSETPEARINMPSARGRHDLSEAVFTLGKTSSRAPLRRKPKGAISVFHLPPTPGAWAVPMAKQTHTVYSIFLPLDLKLLSFP